MRRAAKNTPSLYDYHDYAWLADKRRCNRDNRFATETTGTVSFASLREVKINFVKQDQSSSNRSFLPSPTSPETPIRKM